jgi:amino acid transporter
VSLLVVGAITLLWTFFDLQIVINALITTRVLVQFVGQIIGLLLLRHAQPDRPRPFRVWLAPLPCGLALFGWLYVFAASGWQFIVPSLLTLVAGAAAFLLWSWRLHAWPFSEVRGQKPEDRKEPPADL